MWEHNITIQKNLTFKFFLNSHIITVHTLTFFIFAHDIGRLTHWALIFRILLGFILHTLFSVTLHIIILNKIET
jgi:hypothetical protein